MFSVNVTDGGEGGGGGGGRKKKCNPIEIKGR